MVKVNKFNHNERLNRKKVRIINLISFLLGFSAAIVAYIISSYFKEIKGADNVSAFYAAAYVISLVALLNFHKIIRKFGKSKVFLASTLALSFSAILIFSLPVSRFGALLIVANIILYNLAIVGKDIILESYSVDSMSGQIRGMNLTLMNVGFLLGPFISTQILSKFSFQGVFLLQFAFMSIIFFVAFFHLRKVNHKFKPIVTVNGLIKKITKRKNVMRIYYVSILLDIFYFIMIVYMPIYLRNLGMNWKEIGIIFSLMLIPFILLQYPAGRIADKKMGEKELIILGLLMMSATTLGIFFVESVNMYVWAVVLFLTRVGAALIEILRDSYFYKRIDGTDVDVINFFKTSRPFGFLTASIVSAVSLMFLPLRYIFIILSIVIFSGLYPAVRLKDNLSEEEALKMKK